MTSTLRPGSETERAFKLHSVFLAALHAMMGDDAAKSQTSSASLERANILATNLVALGFIPASLFRALCRAFGLGGPGQRQGQAWLIRNWRDLGLGAMPYLRDLARPVPAAGPDAAPGRISALAGVPAGALDAAGLSAIFETVSGLPKLPSQAAARLSGGYIQDLIDRNSDGSEPIGARQD